MSLPNNAQIPTIEEPTRNTTLIRPAVWHSREQQIEATDKITVRNLEVAIDAGVDVWGRKTKQRVFLTVTISFAQSFDSAAKADALDNSTVHYGHLSKNIRKVLEEDETWLSTVQLAEKIENCVFQTARMASVMSLEVDVFYPKGSMLGEGAGYSYLVQSARDVDVEVPQVVSKVLYLRNVTVPCIIGINTNEKLRKQPVVVNLWIECLPAGRCDEYAQLELLLINFIADSRFETLEALSTKVVNKIRQDYFTDHVEDQQAYIRLRVEKPLAVPFADAPAIEITRRIGV